jgi:hypothetical protein
MGIKSILLFHFLIVANIVYCNTPISLLDAIKLKKISIQQVESNGLGSDNVSLTVKSLSNTPLSLLFEPGLMIIPDDKDFQKLLHTDSVGFFVSARGVAIIKLTAYCTQPSNMGPRPIAGYNTFQQADEQLNDLAKLIFKHQLESRQSLIWEVVRKSSHYKFSTVNELAQDGIKSYFEKFQPTAKLTFGDKNPIYAGNIVSIAANFVFTNETAMSLNFEIQKEDGQFYKKVFENKKYEAGSHIIKFGFSDFFPKETQFKARLTDSAGNVVQEMTVDENTPYIEMEIHSVSYAYKFTVKKLIKNASIILYQPNGEQLRVLKTFEILQPAYHNLNFSFNHYFDPKSKFIVELVDSEGTVYDKTEFDAYRATKKIYQLWK